MITMGLHELLRTELIKVPLEAETKQEAISELIDLLVQHHEVPMAQRHNLIDEFNAGGWSIGSGLERGIAIPHLHTDRVDDFIFALGVAPKGVNFSSLDDKPAKVVFLALAPKKAFAQEVELLRSVEQELEQDDLIGRLAAAGSAQEVFDILASVQIAA